MTKSAWQSVTVQRELSAWNKRIALLGINMSDKELEERLWNFAVVFMQIREKVLAPFDWYYTYFGTWQSWRMFVAPDIHPSKWQLRIREHGVWRTIYQERSPEFVWRRELFDHVQMRYALFLFAWPHYARSYEAFAIWVFSKVSEDFPEAEVVESSFLSYETPTPAMTRAGISVTTDIHSKIVRGIKR